MRNFRGLVAGACMGFVVLVFPVTARSQANLEQELNEIQDLQRRRIQLADAHLHLALSCLAMRDEPAALEHFRHMVALDSGRVLDPDIFSPKVIALLERAQSDVMTNPTKERLENGVQPPEATVRAAPAPIPPQPWVQIQPGTRVRISLPRGSSAVEGRLLSLDDRTLTMISEANQNLSFSRESLAKLEVVKGRKGHWVVGAIIGAILGASSGFTEPTGCADAGDCSSRAENIVYGTLGVGMVGAVVGALTKTNQWAEIPLSPRTPATHSARREGVAVTLPWRF